MDYTLSASPALCPEPDTDHRNCVQSQFDLADLTVDGLLLFVDMSLRFLLPPGFNQTFIRMLRMCQANPTNE